MVPTATATATVLAIASTTAAAARVTPIYFYVVASFLPPLMIMPEEQTEEHPQRQTVQSVVAVADPQGEVTQQLLRKNDEKVYVHAFGHRAFGVVRSHPHLLHHLELNQEQKMYLQVQWVVEMVGIQWMTVS